MKLHLANYEPDRLGGGWTFANNMIEHFVQYPYEEADVYFICGPTMVKRDEFNQAKADGKKIVLRLDNAVRDSRNRNTGMSRMQEFADGADLVIYQSEWAKDYLMPFTKRDGPVILNGCDLDMFKPEDKIPNSYIYSRFNRDETKGWEVARYWFSRLTTGGGANVTPLPELYIVGNFSPELREGNFDFYMGEKYTFLGGLKHSDYAQILRQTENFIYTYFNDACSNSLIEALCAGCKIVGDNYFMATGGAPEILAQYQKWGRESFGLDKMAERYESAIGGIL